MSTKIKTIKGRYQNVSSYSHKAAFLTGELDLTRFWGGTPNGRMLQLTISSDRTAYIQLTEAQVKELAQTLTDCFNDKKYPSE